MKNGIESKENTKINTTTIRVATKFEKIEP